MLQLDIITLYANTLALLNADQDVVIRKAKLGAPLPPELIAKAEELLGVPISEEIKSFYLAANGITLEWSIGELGSENSFYGWLDIWPLHKVVGGEYADENLELTTEQFENAFQEMLEFDYKEGEELAELKKHRMIESHWGVSAYTTIKFDKQATTLFYTDSYGQVPLPLSFSEYVLFAFESLGIDGCRYSLKENEFYASPYSFDSTLQKVKSRFPTTDLCKIEAFCKHP